MLLQIGTVRFERQSRLLGGIALADQRSDAAVRFGLVRVIKSKPSPSNVPHGDDTEVNLDFSQVGRQRRIRGLAKPPRARRPSGQPARRPALQFSAAYEKYGLNRFWPGSAASDSEFCRSQSQGIGNH